MCSLLAIRFSRSWFFRAGKGGLEFRGELIRLVSDVARRRHVPRNAEADYPDVARSRVALMSRGESCESHFASRNETKRLLARVSDWRVAQNWTDKPFNDVIVSGRHRSGNGRSPTIRA